MEKMHVRSLGQKDPLEEGITTHSSILSWETPRTEESGGLQSMGLVRVGRNRVCMRQAYFNVQIASIIL